MAGEPLPATPVEPGGHGTPAQDSATDQSAGSQREPRLFTHEGETWVVEVAGRGTAGTGRFADRGLQLVRFTSYSSPDYAVLEVLTGLRNVELVHEQELLDWFRRAKPPADPADPSTQPSERVPLDEADGIMRADFE